MGISISAKLIFGVEYEELSELENLDEMLDDGDLDYASPHYDSDRCEWRVGIQLPYKISGEEEMVSFIRKAKREFERLTNGISGRIIVSPNVM
ncbi:MAG: hypothetical protein HHJ15_16620 [Rhodoferax sp.]|uniref:hypothetical protein n=1 Tax=Rhodoferax sp. TaxID=50421 RepID=UPI00180A7482|nr:hypothetical protein [Rhodoferax sp.]NMM21553.1 hypothetical protein [Rhodoferax sp.]